MSGYEELLVALAGGGGEEGEELRAWAGRYDPERFTRAAAARRMAKLALGTGPRRI